MVSGFIESVAELLRETAAEVVVPRFRSPAAQPRQKRPGDWVTVADHESEAMLSDRLARLLPGSTVVGEEAVHADPTLLQRLRGDAPVWLIDPVDGTVNFAAGREPFAMIVALLQGGVTTHGWNYLPMEDRMLVAERGAGAELNGVPQQSSAVLPDRLRGIVPLYALPAGVAAHIEGRSPQVADLLPSWRCSGREYPDVVTGAADFVLSPVSMPWDHAAGSLAVTEMGGRCAYLAGDPFTALDDARRTLLVARSPEIWEVARRELLPELPGPAQDHLRR